MRYFEFVNSFDVHNPSMTLSESLLMSDLMQLSTKPLNQPLKKLLSDVKQLCSNFASPTCFISYAWVSEDVFPDQYWTQEFIYRLEVWLNLAGINTIIDRQNSRFGHHMRKFMKENINDSNFILLIGTKALRTKLDSKDFYNVKVEYKFVLRRVLNELSQKKNPSVSPLIISGKGKAALPDRLFGKVAIEDFSGNDVTAGQINSLIHHLQGLIAKLHSIDLTDKNNAVTQKYMSLWENFIKQHILTRGNHAGNLAEENRPPFLYFQQVQHRQKIFGKQKFYLLHNVPENKERTYIGRQDFIQSLSTQIIVNPKPHKSLITVISGLGGVGKTSLAKQIIFQIQSAITQISCSIFWVRVNDQINNNLYQEIIQQLGLDIGANNYATQQKWFFDWLADHPGWILVLDNVTNEEQIQTYLPPYGGNIIITSRNDQWKESSDLIKYDLRLLSETESCELLRQYIKDENDDKIGQLANILGHLPLALVQAGGFIKNNKFLTIDDYIKLLAEQSSQTTQRYKKNKNVWLTLSISLHLIKENSLYSYELLILCSLFGNLDIPNDLLFQIAGYVNFLDFVTKVNPLISYYIIYADKKNKIMSLHPLVSSIVFDELNQKTKREKIEWCLVAIKNIFAKEDSDPKLITAIVGLFLSLTVKSQQLDRSDFAISPILYAETLLFILPILFNQDNMPALNQLEERWINLLNNPEIQKNNELYVKLLDKLVAYRIKTRSEFEFLEIKYNELDTLEVPKQFVPKILLNRGCVAIELGKFEHGVNFFTKAIETGKLSDSEKAKAYGNICTAITQANYPLEKVNRIAQQGYDLINKLGLSPENISLLTYIQANVAEYHVNHKNWDEAKKLRLSNVELLKTVTTRNIYRGISWDYFSLAKIECEVGDFELCRKYYQLFINNMNKVFGQISNWPNAYLKTKDILEKKMRKKAITLNIDTKNIFTIDASLLHETLVNTVAIIEEPKNLQSKNQPSESDMNKKIPDSISFGRYSLFHHNQQDNDPLETLLPEVVKNSFDIGTSVGEGDCFFDTLAQVLNKFEGRELYTVKSLRLLCEEYIKDSNADNHWVRSAIEKNGDDFQQYLARIAFTASEMEEHDQNGTLKGLAIGGNAQIEGRIICERLNIKIHLIEYRPAIASVHPTMLTHQLITSKNCHDVEDKDIDYQAERTAHILVGNNHFVPLLPSIKHNVNTLFKN